MRLFIFFCLAAMFALLSPDAYGQSFNPSTELLQKGRIDSSLRAEMKRLLGVSDQAITEVFALRDSAFARTEKIILDHSLTPGQKNVSIQNLRSQTSEAIKNKLGSTLYSKYINFIESRQPEVH